MTNEKADQKPKPNTTIGPKHAPDDEKIDTAMEDTFPASDPPSHTGVTGPAGDVKPKSS